MGGAPPPPLDFASGGVEKRHFFRPSRSKSAGGCGGHPRPLPGERGARGVLSGGALDGCRTVASRRPGARRRPRSASPRQRGAARGPSRSKHLRDGESRPTGVGTGCPWSRPGPGREEGARPPSRTHPPDGRPPRPPPGAELATACPSKPSPPRDARWGRLPRLADRAPGPGAAGAPTRPPDALVIPHVPGLGFSGRLRLGKSSPRPSGGCIKSRGVGG